METLLKSTAIKRALLFLGAYVIGALIIPLPIYIELLNGLLTGIILAMLIIFWRVIWYVLSNRAGYGRIEQITLGFMFTWLTIALGRVNSVWVRATTDVIIIDKVTGYFTCFVVATGITAGLFTITAPGWDTAYIHQRDRRTLYFSLLIGLLCAVLTFTLQRYKLPSLF